MSYIIQKTWWHYSVCDPNEDTPALRALLNAPDKGIMKIVLKNHDTTRVGVVQINGKDWVIKRYNIKGFWHGLKRSLQPTRAAHCWAISQALLAHGIKTPKAIAMMENRFGFIRREGFFIYEYLPGEVAAKIFTDHNLNDTDILQKAANLIQLIKQLFKHRFLQRDMNPTNFIFMGDIPYLIDLDGIRKSRFDFSPQKITKVFKRFLQYWDNKPKVKNLMAVQNIEISIK